MTDQELNLKVAHECGTANRWLIMKHGLYYRPNAHGYTENIKEAWVVSEEEVNKHVYPHGDQPVTKHRAPVPDYCNDLNACHQMEAGHLDADECATYARLLMKHHPSYCVSVLDGRDRQGDFEYETYQIIHATARQRTEAFARVKGIL